jgi:hypothetical protein
MKRFRKYLLIVCSIFAVAACSKESNEPTRSFYMGFTPFPPDLTLDGADYVYNGITEQADIIDHHFDNGVPWIEAYEDLPFHENIINDWAFRKSRTSPQETIYVSVSALRIDRDSLALYRGAQDNMPLPKPWNTYRFNDEHVKTAYVNYCKRLIEYFQPAFFNMNVEANLLYFVNPSLWTDFLEFHTYVYTQLKAAYPSIKIFSSVTGAHMLQGFFDNNDYVLQRLAVLQIVAQSDLYAISFYPYMSKYLGNAYPDNMFDELFNISDKPLAIAETGYPAQSFDINVNGTLLSVVSDEEKQNKYIGDLLSAVDKRKGLFVINFVLKDYDLLWQQIGGKNDLGIAWRDTGLYDENSKERQSSLTWKKYFKRHLNPTPE